MIFDVMVREGHNADGKAIINVKRVHDSELSAMVRRMQDEGIYILAVIPLFRQRKEEITIATGAEVEEEQIVEHRIFRKDIDPRLIKTIEVVDKFDGI